MHWESYSLLAGATVICRLDWKTILGCSNIITVISVTLAVAGLVVGVFGWLASLRGLRESIEAKERERTAQEAATAARQELMLQRAAEDFRSIVENVENLTSLVASADWSKLRSLLPPLRRQLRGKRIFSKNFEGNRHGQAGCCDSSR